ncbi:unnamed protein product [Calicophoron daubneyi]|uniref:Uncharacterized protein n=1 Tax=Calicophoron daubneyi TaxID=300641 RepID=A0AAV2TYB7_CALDB
MWKRALFTLLGTYFTLIVQHSAYGADDWYKKLIEIRETSSRGRSLSADIVELNSAITAFSLIPRTSRSLAGDHISDVLALKTDANQTMGEAANDTYYIDGQFIFQNDTSFQTAVNLSTGSSFEPVAQSDSSTAYRHVRGGSSDRMTTKLKLDSDVWLVLEIILCVAILFAHFGWVAQTLSGIVLHRRRVLSQQTIRGYITDKSKQKFGGHLSQHLLISYNLQLHLSLVGMFYALTLLVWKVLCLTQEKVVNDADSLPSPEPPVSFLNSHLICGLTRSLSLMFVTIYWLNILVYCIITLRTQAEQNLHASVPSQSWSPLRKSEKFVCYFHMGASWIYAALLRLSSILFTNFPIQHVDELSSNNIVHPILRILSIDCQTCTLWQSRTRISTLCAYTFAEYTLEFVLDFMTSTLPPIVVTVVLIVYLIKLCHHRRRINRVKSQDVFDPSGMEKVLHDDIQSSSRRQILSCGIKCDITGEPKNSDRGERSEFDSLVAYTTATGAEECKRQSVVGCKDPVLFGGDENVSFVCCVLLIGLLFLVVHFLRLVAHIQLIKQQKDLCQPRMTRSLHQTDGQQRSLVENSHTHVSATCWVIKTNLNVELILTALTPIAFQLKRSACHSHEKTCGSVSTVDQNKTSVEHVADVKHKTSDLLKNNLPRPSPSLVGAYPSSASDLLHLKTFSRTEFQTPTLTPTCLTAVFSPDLCSTLCDTVQGEICTVEQKQTDVVPLSIHVFQANGHKYFTGLVPIPKEVKLKPTYRLFGK